MKSRRFLIQNTLLIVFHFTCLFGKCQGYSDFWYFGNKAGIHFDQITNPTALIDSDMNSSEGTITWSDRNGNLLFYGGFDRIWNRNHSIMPNGSDVFISGNNTQCGIVCPNPSDTNEYYIFTLSNDGNISSAQINLYYSVVDMSLNGGLGDIDSLRKNIFIRSFLCEKIVATERCDGQGYWIIVRSALDTEIYTYSLTGSGFDTIPQVSYGLVQPQSPYAGYARLTPDAKFISMYHNNNFALEFLEFNSFTGAFYNPITIPFGNYQHRGYGIEFSPNSKMLYVATINVIPLPVLLVQFDFSVFDSAAIASSADTLADSLIGGGALQLGRNNKVYMCGSSFLHAIHDPNLTGAGCNLELNNLYLAGKYSGDGLPNFSSSVLKFSLPDQTICLGDTAFFHFDDSCHLGLEWNFGDTSSGSNNTDSANNAFHMYSDTGVYLVNLTRDYSAVTKTNTMKVRVLPTSVQNPLPDTLLSCDSALQVSITASLVNYQWSNGSDSNPIIVDSTGLYSVTLSNACMTQRDSVWIEFKDYVSITLSNDTALCIGDSLRIAPHIQNDTAFQWYDGNSTDSTLAVGYWLSDSLKPLTIWVEARNYCGSASDTMTIQFIMLPDAKLQDDTIQCLSQPVFIFRPTDSASTYYWQDSSSSLYLQIDTTVLVTLTATNVCGTDKDSVMVLFHPEIEVELGADTTICKGDSVVLNATWPGASYAWNGLVPQSKRLDSMIVVSEAGQYVVAITHGPCALIEERTLMLDESECDSMACKFDVSNVFTPNADGINDVLRISNLCDSVSYSVLIFNRWGQLVFEQASWTGKGTQLMWDGTIGGIPASEGTYYVKINTSSESTPSKQIAVSVQLIR